MSEATVHLKARYVLMWLMPAGLIGVVAMAFASSGAITGSRPSQDPLLLAILAGGIEGSWFVLTALHARLIGLKVSDLYRWTDVRPVRLALLALPMIGTALVCIYLVFVPLSLIFPDPVHWWLFEDQPVLYLAGDPYPLAGNLAAFVAACLVAPIAEEWIFRGLLLRRWSEKVGTIRAVVRTSLLFCLLHADLLGSFIFAVTMSGLYARYRSLWAPTIVHVANNSLAFAMAAVVAHTGATEPSTVAELRAQWWVPLVGLALVVPWAIRLRKIWVPIASWRFEPVRQAPPPPSETESPEVA